MNFLLQLLPIIVYFLLVVLLIVGIILIVKLIIVIDKANTLIDDINRKVAQVTPIFDMMGIVSNKVSGVVTGVMNTIENISYKLFNKRKKENKESEDYE